MHVNWNSYSDFLPYRGLIQYSAAPSHIGDGFSEAITHRPAAFSKRDHASGSVLCDCPSGFGRARCCGSSPLRPLLCCVLRFHQWLPQSLPPRKCQGHCQGYAQKCFLHFTAFLFEVAAVMSCQCSRFISPGRHALQPSLGFEPDTSRGCVEI